MPTGTLCLWVEEKGLNPESRNSSDNVPKIDFDRLFSDSIAYNENLKKRQHELLTNEQSYQSPAFVYAAQILNGSPVFE